MLYNRCTGIYKFGNNAYPWRIKRRSNLVTFFGKKYASYGPGNTVLKFNSRFVISWISNKWRPVVSEKTCFWQDVYFLCKPVKFKDSLLKNDQCLFDFLLCWWVKQISSMGCEQNQRLSDVVLRISTLSQETDPPSPPTAVPPVVDYCSRQ